MKILDMSLKEVFMEPIHLGVKTVEYRDMTPYWAEKLLNINAYGKPVEDVIDGLMHGDLDIKPNGWTHIRFHQSGGTKTILVEMGEIKTYPGRHTFCISLGKIVGK